jgi:HlyD family secretion protein
VAVGIIAIVVTAAALAERALADTSSGNASFRTATVKRATVSQTLQRSGTIEPVAQGTVSFPISGRVASVAVQPAQTVTTGQALAALDTAALEATVTSKQATLAAAQLTLDKALNGQSSASGGTSATDSTKSGSARQAVASDQQKVDGALANSQVALRNASSSCGAGQGGGGTSGSTFKSTSGETTTTTTPQSSSDCIKALQSSLDAQQSVAAAQSDLAKAETTLDNLLSSASSSSSSGGSGQASGATTSGTAAGQGSASSTPSSAELVADQAAVDAAQADVTAAQQNLAQATIVSPIDGTVAAVNLKTGDQVSAASSTANIVVVGPGGYEVTTTVPVADIGKVKPGNAATVLPDGSSTAVDGKVVSIAVMPTTSGTTTTYAVVIGLTGSPSGLRNGAAAAVTITLSHVADALTVPTSAVRTAGGGALHVVTVLAAGKTSLVPIGVGAVGADLTEVTSGLQDGQAVVLADLHQAVPSNTNANIRGLGGGGGGFGGATLGR